MKKFLSLVLAVLMVSGLVISASAVGIKDQTQEQSKTLTIGKLTNAGDLAELLAALSGTEEKYTPGYGVYTTWYDACPKCGGLALYYIKNGNIYWQCMEDGCEKSGTYTYKTEAEKDETEKEDSKKTDPYECPYCKSAKNTLYIDETVHDDKLCERYFCTKCDKSYYVAVSKVTDEYGVRTKINCLKQNCDCNAYLEDYEVEDGSLIAHYKCTAGHTCNVVITDDFFDDEYYRISVSCSKGGKYSINGSETAKYNSERTITFTPNSGYVLTDVKINGTSYGAKTKITLTVEGNVTIRAEFEKEASSKSYKLVAEATKGGKITATKNGSTASADSISAKYSDTVVYKFTPASSNYVIKDVVIDGKSKGSIKSYTFSKIDDSHTIEVTFAWSSPYQDVSSKYLNAVEYVTENGIMSYAKTAKTTKGKTVYYFKGTTKVTIGEFACALAEMADTSNKLSNDSARLKWAVKYGLITKYTDTSAVCGVQNATSMVRALLDALAEINDVTFTGVKAKDSAKQTGINIKLISEKTYNKNRDMTRYDIAAVCKLISGISYKAN